MDWIYVHLPTPPYFVGKGIHTEILAQHFKFEQLKSRENVNLHFFYFMRQCCMVLNLLCVGIQVVGLCVVRFPLYILGIEVFKLEFDRILSHIYTYIYMFESLTARKKDEKRMQTEKLRWQHFKGAVSIRLGVKLRKFKHIFTDLSYSG